MITQKDWVKSSSFEDEIDYDNFALKAISSEKLDLLETLLHHQIKYLSFMLSLSITYIMKVSSLFKLKSEICF